MTGSQRGGIIFRLLSLIFLAALFFMLYLARHPLLRLAGAWLVVSDPLQHADAMIVLGDDNFSGDRAGRVPRNSSRLAGRRRSWPAGACFAPTPGLPT